MPESSRDKTIEVMARAMGAPVEGPEGEKWGEYPPFNRFARLALDALQASGMAVVAVEPTEAMLRDGAARAQDFYTEKGLYPRTQAVWKAMLAAHAKEGT